MLRPERKRERECLSISRESISMHRCPPPPVFVVRFHSLSFSFMLLLVFVLLSSEICNAFSSRRSHDVRQQRRQQVVPRWRTTSDWDLLLTNHPQRREASQLHRCRLLITASSRSSSRSYSSSSSSSSSDLSFSVSNNENNNNDNSNRRKIRLNKVFKATHSRRQADALIASGCVTVNGQSVPAEGCLVEPWKDVVCLDGKKIKGWEALNGIANNKPVLSTNLPGEPTGEISSQTNHRRRQQKHATTKVFEYIKYWKPVGITCTTDRRIGGNILDALEQDSSYRPPSRVYPIGRLDKDTSGLILLTNDGRLPNALLRNQFKQPKVYNVLVDKTLRPEDIKQLRSGVVITTVAQRDRKVKPLTAKTKPCQVRKVNERGVQIVLTEGRNRQIRKMMSALGYRVIKLHRMAMGDISLRGMNGPGSWERLRGSDLAFIQNILESLDGGTAEEA